MGFAGTRRDHRDVEHPEADRGEFAEQSREVAEMMRRRGVRDAGLARHRAQRQPGEPVALQHPLGRLQQRLVQVAMMIGGLARGAAAPSGGTFRHGLCRPAGS